MGETSVRSSCVALGSRTPGGVALAILRLEFDRAAELLEAQSGDVTLEGDESHANPWELLLIAFYYFLPSACFAAASRADVADPRNLSQFRSGMAAVDIAHFLGWVGIGFSVAVLGAYLWLTPASKRPPLSSS